MSDVETPVSGASEEAPKHLKLVDREVIDKVYSSLLAIHIQLDEDPLGGGPTRLNEKMAKAANMQTRVRNWQQVIAHKSHLFNRQHRLVAKNFEMLMRDRTLYHPKANSFKSQKDRENAAKLLLSDELEELESYEEAKFELEAVLEALKLKDRDIRDLIQRLRDQMRLCQEEIKIGRRWGKSHNVETVNESATSSHISESAFDDLLDDILTDSEPAGEGSGTVKPSVTKSDSGGTSSGQSLEMEESVEDIDFALDSLGDIDLSPPAAPVLPVDSEVSDLPDGFWDSLD